MSGALDHRTFVIRRLLPGDPAHAFRFWSDPALKRQWNSCHPDWDVLEDCFDFRDDGFEHLVWRTPEGVVQEMLAHFFEVAERERIVYAYTMRKDGRSFSSSLVTVEFEGKPSGTQMTFTEQAMFLDARDGDIREKGTGLGFDCLAEVIQAALAN